MHKTCILICFATNEVSGAVGQKRNAKNNVVSVRSCVRFYIGYEPSFFDALIFRHPP